MSAGATRRLAAFMAITALAMLVASVVILVPNAAGRTLADLGANGVGGIILSGTYPIVGWMIASRRPGNRIGWIFLVVGLSQSLEGLSTQYAMYGLVTAPGSLPLADVASWVAKSAWVPGFLLLGMLVLLFPDGELPSARWRPLVWVSGVAFALMLVPVAVVAWPYRGAALIPQDWGAGDRPVDIANALQLVGVLLSLLVAIAAVAAVVVRFRRSSGIERQQLKWFAYASLAEIVMLMATQLGIVPAPLDMIVAAVVTPLVPVAIGIAILRYRLYELDRIISRTVGWAIVTGVLVAVFAGAVVLLQAVLAPFTRENTLAVAASTLVACALFQPLRRLVQRAVDRRFDRARYDGQRTVDAFATRVRNDVDLASLRTSLAATAAQAVRPASSSVWLSARGAR
jgi:hypothetical protein